MNGDPGFCLAAWSDQFSSWVSVAVFRERARISIWPAALRCSAVLSRLFRWRPSMMRTRKRRPLRSCGRRLVLLWFTRRVILIRELYFTFLA